MGKKKRPKKKRDRRSAQERPVRPARSEPEKGDAEVALRVVWKLLKLAVWITSVLVVVKLFAGTPDYASVAATLAGLLVIYDLFDVVNWERILYLRERSLWPLLAAYVGCLLVMALIAISGFYAQDWWIGVLVVVLFVLAVLARMRIEKLICKHLSRLGVDKGEPRWFSGLSRRLDDIVREYARQDAGTSSGLAQFAQRRLADWLRAGMRGPLASARRLVALGVMIACVVLGAWSGLATAARVISAISSSPNSATTTTPNTHTSPTAAAATPPSSASATTSSSFIAAGVPPFAQCAVPPGTGAPSWAKGDISHLYLGAPGVKEAPGTAIAGCPDRYHTLHSRDGEFVYTIGEGPGNRALSIAVDSKRFGPALFLAPAVRPVLDLINRLGPLGGFRRFTVGSGQFYPVQTDRGTYLLIRRETGGEETSQPFVVIPPAVTQAWAAATRAGRFLWPVPPSRSGDREYRFQTSTDPPQTAYSFTYHPSRKSEPELSGVELAGLAATPE